MSKMRFQRLISGSNMPSIGLGTFQMKGDKLKEALDFAMSIGYSHIDTAVVYGNEKEIGEVVNDRLRARKIKRKDLFITSKVYRTSLSKNDVLKSTQKSLEDLKLSSVDMLLIHSPWPCLAEKDEHGNLQNHFVPLNILETWRAMESVHKEGLASHIGVSNFTADQLNSVLDIQTVPVSNVQLEAHIYYQQRSLNQLCHDNGIVVSAYAPLGAPDRPTQQLTRSDSVLDDPLIRHLSQYYRKTPAQVVLNFLLRCGMVVLPKSSNLQRLQENFGCLDWSLRDVDVKAIRGLDRGVKFFEFLYMRGHPDYFEGKEF